MSGDAEKIWEIPTNWTLVKPTMKVVLIYNLNISILASLFNLIPLYLLILPPRTPDPSLRRCGHLKRTAGSRNCIISLYPVILYPVILYPVIRIWQMKRPVTWVSKNYLQFLHRILEAIFCGHSAQVLAHFYTRKVDSEGIALLKTQNFCVLHKLNSEGGFTRKKVRSDK